MLPFLPHEFLAQIIAQQLASGRERQCELLLPAPIPSGAVEKNPPSSFETAATRSLARAVTRISRSVS